MAGKASEVAYASLRRSAVSRGAGASPTVATSNASKTSKSARKRTNSLRPNNCRWTPHCHHEGTCECFPVMKCTEIYDSYYPNPRDPLTFTNYLVAWAGAVFASESAPVKLVVAPRSFLQSGAFSMGGDLTPGRRDARFVQIRACSFPRVRLCPCPGMDVELCPAL